MLSEYVAPVFRLAFHTTRSDIFFIPALHKFWNPGQLPFACLGLKSCPIVTEYSSVRACSLVL